MRMCRDHFVEVTFLGYATQVVIYTIERFLTLCNTFTTNNIHNRGVKSAFGALEEHEECAARLD
jgi:hypothetical protein